MGAERHSPNSHVCTSGSTIKSICVQEFPFLELILHRSFVSLKVSIQEQHSCVLPESEIQCRYYSNCTSPVPDVLAGEPCGFLLIPGERGRMVEREQQARESLQQKNSLDPVGLKMWLITIMNVQG